MINYAGKDLCYKILHEKENLSEDGEKFCRQLKDYKNDMDFQIYKEILCPPNEIIDENKFDLSIYMMVICCMFDEKYDANLTDIRLIRNEIFHMEGKSICKKKFEQLWNKACKVLSKNGFDMKAHNDLKDFDMFLAEGYKGILEILSFA